MPMQHMMLGYNIHAEPIPGDDNEAKQVVIIDQQTGESWILPLPGQVVRILVSQLKQKNDVAQKLILPQNGDVAPGTARAIQRALKDPKGRHEG
jgi:hypothetical protein